MKRIEYLESTGTQYIDTGFKPNNNSGIDIVIDSTNCSGMSYPSPFGSRGNGTTSYNNNQFFVGIQSNETNTTWFLRYGTSTYKSTFGTKYGYNRIIINKNAYTIGNDSYTFSAETFSSDYNLFLFGYDCNGSLGQGSNGFYHGRIYSCKVYDNGTLVRDFVPILDDNDVPCMYDQLNNQLYYNAGTGTFSTGSVVDGNAYYGINNVAQKAKNIYFGVNNIARKVVKAYIGVYGIARQFYNKTVTPVDPYDYGDGSLNQTQMGYQNKLYVNGVLDTSSLSATNWGNYQIPSAMYSLLYDTAEVSIPNNSKIRIYSGLNTYSINMDATSGDKTCNLRITAGGGTSSASISSLQFNCNGSYLNLSEMVSLGIIKPLVLIVSSGANNYSWHNVLNLYTNSAGTDVRSYPEALFFFMINAGNYISAVKFDASVNFSASYDGMTYVRSSIDDVRMTLNAYT